MCVYFILVYLVELHKYYNWQLHNIMFIIFYNIKFVLMCVWINILSIYEYNESLDYHTKCSIDAIYNFCILSPIILKFNFCI